MKNSFRLHLFVKENFLYCRIYAQNKYCELSTGIKITSDYFNAEAQSIIIKGKEKEALQQKALLLDEIKSKLRSIYEDFNYRYKNHDIPFSATDIKNVFLGKTTTQEKGLLEYLKVIIASMESTIGSEGGYDEGTVRNYYMKLSNLEDFIKAEYRKEDLPMSQIKKDFPERMKSYFATQRLKKNTIVKFSPVYVAKHLQVVNKVLNLAVQNDFLAKNPLKGITLPGTNYMAREIVYLEIEELSLLESYNFPAGIIRHVADCFIFSCHTGLAYMEQLSLRADNIKIGIDGKKWISIVRSKTKRYKPLPVKIPLDDKALEILEKYQRDEYCQMKGLLLPVHANGVYNRYVKLIAATLGFQKHLTVHSARKTFATLLLNNGVPIGTVAAMVGDSVAVIERHYARIIERTIARDMEAYQQRMQKS